VRDLLLAGALALALHALLFALKPDWVKSQNPSSSIPEIITLTLTFKENQTQTASPAAMGIDPEEKPAPLQRASQRKPVKTKSIEPTPRSPEKKGDRSGVTEDAGKDNVPSSLPAFDHASGINTGANGPSMTGAGTPSQHGGEGNSTTASLSSWIRQATPLYRRNPVPEYPLIGRKRGYQGTVTLEVLVNREGRVEDLRLSTSSGYSVLDQAALTSVRTWLFHPGTRGEEKVDMWVKVPVRFQLE
jgi:protein TonB